MFTGGISVSALTVCSRPPTKASILRRRWKLDSRIRRGKSNIVHEMIVIAAGLKQLSFRNVTLLWSVNRSRRSMLVCLDNTLNRHSALCRRMCVSLTVRCLLSLAIIDTHGMHGFRFLRVNSLTFLQHVPSPPVWQQTPTFGVVQFQFTRRLATSKKRAYQLKSRVVGKPPAVAQFGSHGA